MKKVLGMNLIMLTCLVLGIVALIFWYRSGTSEGFSSEGFKMVMYGVDWCPHCVEAKPEFEKLGATQTIGGKLVEFAVVNPEQDKKAAEGKNISGYPTFHLYDSKGALVADYDQNDRTESGFLGWLKSKL
jgi:thiol-disulfide isomerase/thioredoxin